MEKEAWSPEGTCLNKSEAELGLDPLGHFSVPVLWVGSASERAERPRGPAHGSDKHAIWEGEGENPLWELSVHVSGWIRL